MFSGCNVPPDSKETQLGNKDKEVSPSASKNTKVILMSFCAWKCVSTAISYGTVNSEVLGLICYGR